MIMPSKRKGQKRDFNKYAQQFLPFILSMISENKENMIKGLGGILNLKRTIARYGILFIMTFVAIFIMVEGMGLFIGSIFPYISPGVFHMTTGLALLIIALVYKSVWKI